MSKLKNFVTHLECSDTGKHYPKDHIHTLSDTGRIDKNESVLLFNCATGYKNLTPPGNDFIDSNEPISFTAGQISQD